MSQTFSVECPACHAKGELADSSLIGQAISCPACNATFMVVAQAPAIEPMSPPTPAVALASFVTQPDSVVAVPPEPVTRSSFQRHKQPSKLIPTLVWGSIGGTIAVWGI